MKSVMNSEVVILNSTDISNNPGCKFVGLSYDLLCKELNLEITSKVDVNFGISYYSDIAVRPKNARYKNPGEFTQFSETAPAINFDLWSETSNSIYKDFIAAAGPLSTDKTYIVNGEGSIHHNFKRALAILNLIAMLKREGCRTFLLNSTIMSIDENLLEHSLAGDLYIQSRETRTHDYLKKTGIGSVMAPDLATLAIDAIQFNQAPKRDRSVLVTLGIFNQKDDVELVLNSLITRGLEPTYLDIGDGGDEAAVQIAQDLGCKVHKIPVFEPKLFLEFLSQFEFAISGRHHINLILMRLGIPFVPIQSNTWKVSATCDYLSYPVKVPISHVGFEATLEDILHDPSLSDAAKDAFATARQKLSAFKQELGSCL